MIIEKEFITEKNSIISISEKKITILHIDDEPEVLEITKIFLERLDRRLEIISTKSHEEFFEIIDNNKIEAIIADYQMPGLNGLDLLEETKKEKIDIPFIIFTGRGQEETAISAFNRGAKAYITKRTNIRSKYRELYDAIYSILKNDHA